MGIDHAGPEAGRHLLLESLLAVWLARWNSRFPLTAHHYTPPTETPDLRQPITAALFVLLQIASRPVALDIDCRSNLAHAPMRQRRSVRECSWRYHTSAARQSLPCQIDTS